MNISQIEEEVKSLVKKIDKETFIYDMLLAYGAPKATITRAKKGTKNLSNNENEIVIKKKVFFGYYAKSLKQEYQRVVNEESTLKHNPRFVIATDYNSIKALDTKLNDEIEFPIKELPKKFDFFLPLAGIEKKEFKHENPVDVKAAEKLAKLFDLIKRDNPKSDEDSLHSLNVFLTRLLFCFFAEDTGIFGKGLFTKSIASHTQLDGTDLSDYLLRLFTILNNKKRQKNTPDYINEFPYVNGGLFRESYEIPKFSKKSREVLIEIGDLDWAEINPDIFGSMIQAVVHPDQRAGLGMHYTSVSNIKKLIDPLFMNELREEFVKSNGSKKKLGKLLQRICDLKVFDPACGSGNFLIIAYKELRKLEMEIIKSMNEIPLSGISLSNFYGIEIDDFAHEVAALSLWLAEHQMNMVFKTEFGTVRASLPLQEGGNIVCGNAALESWENVCPNNEGEIVVIGNPPYLGARQQDKDHKSDISEVYGNLKGSKNLDYISIWFKKGADYIRGKNSRYAFVSTNSICQGAQVEILWPTILDDALEISFAHKDFKWTNNAKNQAAVICVIVGIQNKSKGMKRLFYQDHEHEVKNINAYLTYSEDVYINSQNSPLSDLPPVNYGSFALDDGNFTLSSSEVDDLESLDAGSKKYIREFIGARELIQGVKRYCVWINDDDVNECKDCKPIWSRVKKVKKWRSESDREATRKLSDTPYRFAEIRQPESDYLAFPTVSSERREYIPIGFLNSKVIASNQIYVIPNANLYHFGILSSRIHMCWVRAVGGRMKTDIRYSAAICYNTFPIPNLDEDAKESIANAAREILAVRERNSQLSLAVSYDPEKMPSELLEAHKNLDRQVDLAYGLSSSINDGSRLKRLFDLYITMKKVSNE